MKNVRLFKAESRGHANHGWLDTYHTFSFANYRDNDRINFGVLRVLNDDKVAGGMGFGTHPHENMEIISIPTSGRLEHRDSMGNGGIVDTGEIQVMSAGTGIQHSEFNPSKDQESKFFQIWLFPDTLNLEPRHQQIQLSKSDRNNKWDQVISPDKNEKGAWIHQNAWFHLADLEKGKSLTYTLKDPKNNGVFLMLIEGEAKIGDFNLNRRDGIGFDQTEEFEISAKENSEILLMEVPMKLPSYLR